MNISSEIVEVIKIALNIDATEIKNIKLMKQGMTNKSFMFECKDKKYIMRIPGEGTAKLINRKYEYEVYRQLNRQGVCDNVVYIDPDNGYKITEYIQNSRVCNSDDLDDVKKCILFLRDFHKKKLKVDHEFDLFNQIEYYESLKNKESKYSDYNETKAQIYELRTFIEKCDKSYALAHIDSVSDNFLFYSDEYGNEKIVLIDWEYSGMQDQHIDIAMFCIYSMYDKKMIDKIIDIYFDNLCKHRDRIKIYCYIAICGLLWSNWCEYKGLLGIEFGEYSYRQYNYAREYYRLAKEMITDE